MKIIGTSGVSVFLAAQVMRKYNPVIYLENKELVNNHTAVLRFKDEKISEFLNIPFKKVTIDKLIKSNGSFYNRSNLKFQNMYSQKVVGSVLDRSIRDLSSSVRYIAPSNLFYTITRGFEIHYGADIVSMVLDNSHTDVKLSYVKMPELTRALNIPQEYNFNPIITINATIESPDIDVYQTIYYPDLNCNQYRASITGNQLIIELTKDINMELGSEDFDSRMKEIINTVLEDFSIYHSKLSNIEYNLMPVGKMGPIDNIFRKRFIRKLTLEYNTYSFGRNGIWKSIRLDQVFSDLMSIDKFIQSGGLKLM